MAKPIPTTNLVYIGKKYFVDRLYGSGLDFEPNQVREVPSELARSFLRHADLFAVSQEPGGTIEYMYDMEGGLIEVNIDNTAELLELQAKKDKEAAKSGQELQDLLMQVSTMDKNALSQFAKDRYQVDLNKRKAVETLREEVIGLINQFGAM